MAIGDGWGRWPRWGRPFRWFHAQLAAASVDPLDAFNTMFNGGSLVIYDSSNVELLNYTLATPAATGTGPTTGTLNCSPAQPNTSVTAAANTSSLPLIGKLKSVGDTHEAWYSVSVLPDTSGDIVLDPGSSGGPGSWSGDAIAINSATVTMVALDHYTVTPATVTPTPGATVVCTIQACDVDGNALPISGLVVTASVIGNGSISAGSPATTTGDGKATVTYTAGTIGQTGHVHVVDANGIVGDSATITAAPGVIDTFHRANSAVTLGNADSGQAWDPRTGTWGRISNTAYSPVTGTGQPDGAKSIAVIDSTLADCTVQATLATFGGFAYDAGIVFRYQDDNNFWILVSYDTWKVFKVVAGSPTLVTYDGPAAANGQIPQVILSGNTITPSVSGVAVGSPITDSFCATATKHGLLTNTSTFSAFSAQ
jgi:hypothetical protein